MNALGIILLAVMSQAFSLSLKERVNENFSQKAMENEGLYEGDMAGIDPNNRNAITEERRLWTNGIVYYEIDPSLENNRRLIRQGMEHITQKTNGCIRFVESRRTGNYVEIGKHEGCWSKVGMVGGKQELSIGIGCKKVGIVVHELCHALGLHHEQNRSDRDEYLSIIWDNVIPDMKRKFVKMKKNQNFLMTPYDYDSIMQYGETAFSLNGQVTMQVIDRSKSITSVSNKAGLTDMDAFILQSLYSCPGHTRPPPKNPPVFNCDYENKNDKCGFRNDYKKTVARIIKEGGNNFITIDQPGRYARIITRRFTNYNYTICLSFKYRIKGGLQQPSYVHIYVDDFVKNVDFEEKSTNGWVTKKIEMKPPSGFRAYIDVKIGNSTGSSFSLDDFSVTYESCK